MLDRVHLRQERDGELVFGHCGADAWVIAEAFEELEGSVWVGEIGEWEQAVEGVAAACV